MVNDFGIERADGKMDVEQLATALWRKKNIIVITTVTCILLGGMYAFLSTPIYESKILVGPPAQTDIAELNYGRTSQAELTPVGVKDVYDLYTKSLHSEALRRQAYEEAYLPSFSSDEVTAGGETRYQEFDKKLAAKPAPQDGPDRYVITMQDASVQRAERVLRAYIGLVEASAKNEIVSGVNAEAAVRARNLGDQIATLRKASENHKEDALTKLEEALRVAKAINLKSAPIITGPAGAEVSANMTSSLAYMRGSKAIEAEINNIKSRRFDDAFIEQLRPLQVRYDYYANIKVDPQKISVAAYDGDVAVPVSPIKPRKALILVASAVVGLLLGVCLALGSLMRRSRKH